MWHRNKRGAKGVAKTTARTTGSQLLVSWNGQVCHEFTMYQGLCSMFFYLGYTSCSSCLRQGLCLLPFCRWNNWGLETWDHPPDSWTHWVQILLLLYPETKGFTSTLYQLSCLPQHLSRGTGWKRIPLLVSPKYPWADGEGGYWGKNHPFPWSLKTCKPDWGQACLSALCLVWVTNFLPPTGEEWAPWL